MTAQTSSAVVSILFVFFALTTGSIILYICSRFDHVLPYSVVIFAFGTLVAIVADFLTKQQSGDVLILSTEQWIRIDPDVLLCSFLPALLFGEAMHLNFHQIRKAILPASLLAFPGAAFGAYILALFCYSNGLPVTWSWRMCFIVGAVLSATDPVSVVATLKGLSSSSTSTIKLTYLIVGEALLNDGMALVLFEALIRPDFDTPVKIIYYFFRVIFISPFLGCAFGVGCILTLRMANRRVSHDDVIVQLAVTVGCAYISFFVAQYIFGVSGVICTCAAGVTVAWLGPPLIIQRHSMTTIWEFLEYVCNTLVFMVAGMIVGRYIVYFATPLEYGCIIIIYLTIFVIRFFMLLLCYPLMQYLSEGYSFNDLYFSTFAGLRGAVSLALCIVIQSHVDSDNPEEDHRVTFPKQEIRQVIFIICAVVALTILINGSFSRSFYTVMYSKINSQTAEADSVILHYVRKRIWQKAEIVLDQLGGILPHHNQVLVVKICEGVFDENILRSTRGGAKAAVKNVPRRLLHDGMPDIRQFTNQYKKSEIGSNRKKKFQKEEVEVEDERNSLDEGETKNDFRYNLPELILFPNEINDETSSHSDDILLLSPGTPQLRRKHPISSTFFTRISPVVSSRKTFYGSPIKNQDVNINNNNSNDDNRNGSSNNNIRETVSKSKSNDSINNISVNSNNNSDSNIDMNNETFDHIGDSRRYEEDKVVNQDTIIKEGSSSEKKRRRRDINSTVDESLIIKFRLIFLGVTKTDYIKQIHSGRLPRGSLAAIVLLDSIDVGLETAHTDGLQDWDSVKASLMRVTSCEVLGNQYCMSRFGIKSIESICNKDRVFILTSFIAAHKHAHDTVLFYLGEQEGISTPEEKLVVEESVTIVQQAEEWLAKIDPRIVSMHVTRQAASIVLQAADDLVLKFIDEGILTTKAAKTFFDITTKARFSISTVCESNENDFTKSKIDSGCEAPFKKIVNDDNVPNSNRNVECFNDNEKDEKCIIQIDEIGVKKSQFQNFEKMEIATHDVIINDLNQSNNNSRSKFSSSPLESNRISGSDFSINIDTDDDENISTLHASK